MRVRLWLKSTRISVATCQKERIVRRYFSLHWGAGACPANKCGIATTKHSVSCNNTLRRFQRHGRLQSAPTKKHTTITATQTSILLHLRLPDSATKSPYTTLFRSYKT